MSRRLRADRSFVLAALIALAAGLAPTSARAGACARPSLMPGLMTPAGRGVPAGEGLLLGLHGGLPLLAAEGDTRRHDALGIVADLERGEQRIALDVEELAPGLARIVPRSRPAPGTWTLVSGEHRHPIRVVASAPPPPLRAPRVREVWYRHHTPDTAIGGIGGGGAPRGRGGPSTFVGAELERTPPDDAVAVIAVIVIGERTSPRMSRALPTRSLAIELYQATGARCATASPGEPVPPGSVVRLHWVDAFGRLSPPSNDVTVVTR